MAYDVRVQQEIDNFAKVENIHDLPKIYGYWADRFLCPAMKEVFGVDWDVKELYANAIKRSAPKGGARVISLGCGYGDMEIGVADLLLDSGYRNFRIVCADLSPVLISRLRDTLPKRVSRHIEPMVCDLNEIAIDETFDCVIAHHSLHHIVKLEHVFDWAHAHISDQGVFATCDMIGRNGHMRWPEVEVVLRSLWSLLPDQKRYNHQRRQVEERFQNIDCSGEGFEGIRAQDILPLLLQRFHPSRFVGVGGLIDPFIDRGFGHNFNPEDPKDAAFITAAGVISDTLLDSGAAKPTIMLAEFTKTSGEQVYFRNRSAYRSIRAPWEPVGWAKSLMELV